VIKVNQTIIDKDNGNCMQAAFASLLNLKLEDVPHFITYENHHGILRDFLRDNGYVYNGMLHNMKFQRLFHNNEDCFNKVNYHHPVVLTKSKLIKDGGIDGFFFAGVISPKYGHIDNQWYNQHAVIIDINMNIVHDPNPEYTDLIKYPLSNIIGCNGIIDVTMIKKITK
jgi:hypothetical protein